MKTEKGMSRPIRVAICISGHIRSWKQTKANFVSSLLSDKDAEIDVYLYTYYQLDTKEGEEKVTEELLFELFSDIPVKKWVMVDDTPSLDEETENFLQRLCDRKYDSENVVRGSYNGMLSIHRCNKLRREEEYDLVMRTRFDVIYFRPINWSKLALEDNQLIIGFGSTLGAPNDMVGIGKPGVMDAYCDEFLRIRKIFAPEQEGWDRLSFVMHTVLKSAIDRKGLALKYVQIALLKTDGSLVFHDLKKYVDPALEL
jgi:hypothetical protein